MVNTQFLSGTDGAPLRGPFPTKSRVAGSREGFSGTVSGVLLSGRRPPASPASRTGNAITF